MKTCAFGERIPSDGNGSKTRLTRYQSQVENLSPNSYVCEIHSFYKASKAMV